MTISRFKLDFRDLNYELAQMRGLTTRLRATDLIRYSLRQPTLKVPDG